MTISDCRNLTVVNDFRDPQEYIYNSDLVEFTNFGVRLKNLVANNIAGGATFKKEYFLNYSKENIFATPYIFGTVTIEQEKLALIGGMFNKQWTLPIIEGKTLGDVLPQGEIHFTYFPNYSNCPQTTQHIFTFGTISDENDKKNLIEIQHTSTGDFLFSLFDRGGYVTETNITRIIEYANTPIVFALSWNTVTEPAQDSRVKFNLFMDGNSVVKYDLDSETFDIDKILQFSLGNMIGSFKPNFLISNFVVLNNCPLILSDQYAITEDKLYPLPQSRYTTTPQKVEPLFFIELEVLKNIVALTNNSDEVDRGFYVGFTFKIGTTEYYFDRTDLSWKVHQSPEQISDLGYMLAYKEQLLGSMGGIKFKCVPYLRTIKGDSTPAITSQTITYDKFVPYREPVPTALIYGYVRDSLGNFIKNAKIVVTPSRSSVAETGNFILPMITKSVRTGNNGYWDVQLPLSTNFTPEVLYNFQVLYRDEVVFEKANIRISKEGTIKFEDLIPTAAGYAPASTRPQGSTPVDSNQFMYGMWWQEVGNIEPDNPDHNDIVDTGLVNDIVLGG